MGRATFIAVVSIFGLSACAFVPSYKQDLYDQIADVQSQLSKISTAVSIAGTTPPPYEKIEPYYIAALADLDQAKTTTSAAANYSVGHISEVPSKKVNNLISVCSAAIERDRAYYKANLPVNEADNIKTVKDTCLVSKQVTDLMKK